MKLSLWYWIWQWPARPTNSSTAPIPSTYHHHQQQLAFNRSTSAAINFRMRSVWSSHKSAWRKFFLDQFLICLNNNNRKSNKASCHRGPTVIELSVNCREAKEANVFPSLNSLVMQKSVWAKLDCHHSLAIVRIPTHLPVIIVSCSLLLSITKRRNKRSHRPWTKLIGWSQSFVESYRIVKRNVQ